jgi:hypothetical protein
MLYWRPMTPYPKLLTNPALVQSASFMPPSRKIAGSPHSNTGNLSFPAQIERIHSRSALSRNMQSAPISHAAPKFQQAVKVVTDP